jgi:hypothetical protein
MSYKPCWPETTTVSPVGPEIPTLVPGTFSHSPVDVRREVYPMIRTLFFGAPPLSARRSSPGYFRAPVRVQ